MSTTLPRNAWADRGSELSQVVAPDRSDMLPSTGSVGNSDARIPPVLTIAARATGVAFSGVKGVSEKTRVRDSFVSRERGERNAGSLHSSASAKALEYSLRRWEALTRFVDDGQLPVDNNWIENKIRPIAIGRNNWLFAGSLRAASGRQRS